MKGKTVIILAVLAVSLVCASQLMADSTAKQHKQETERILHRMDEFASRAELISRDVKQLMMEKGAHSASKYELMIQMNELLESMAIQFKSVVQQSHSMMENKTLMADEQFQRDTIAVRDQLDRMTSCMSNTLQYMEHMTYRLNMMATGK